MWSLSFNYLSAICSWFTLFLFPFFQFCFAYKGPIKDEVKFQVKYGGSNDVKYNYHTFAFSRTASRSNWGFSCINVWDHISEEYAEMDATSVEMNSIEIVRLEGEGEHDIYIDNVWIGKNLLAGKSLQ